MEAKEYMKKYNKKYYQEHKEEIKKSQDSPEFKKKNRIRQREWKKNNPEKLKIQRREYKRGNLVEHLRNRVYAILKLYTKTGKIMGSRKYGINYKAIINHLRPFPENLSAYHIHHIKPLFTFDFNDSEEIKKAFAPENHQLMLIEEHRKLNHFHTN
ncbi:MAG TPA: hypothetical protein ENI02_02950 [Candidatus Aminicenantes bacterium]|nr:hypothetical protein [Candidatus Aminicenantes bacterium]